MINMAKSMNERINLFVTDKYIKQKIRVDM